MKKFASVTLLIAAVLATIDLQAADISERFPLSAATIYTDVEDYKVVDIAATMLADEWRWNVLRGYAVRRIQTNAQAAGSQRIRIYLLDPGIVLQEIIM